MDVNRGFDLGEGEIMQRQALSVMTQRVWEAAGKGNPVGL